MSDSETVSLTKSAPGAAGGITLNVPRQIGSVRLERLVGRGGMGEVWRGRDEILGRDVAVKFVLDATAAPGDAGWETFLAGARAAAAVQHPGLVGVFSADLIEGVPYLIMEYVDGPTLAQVLARLGRLELGPALAALEGAAAAVAALHEHDVVHGDIKPSNLMLDAQGRVRVTDFGLSYERGTGMYGPGTDRVIGTPAYMAPEMFEGGASSRSDVYALAMTGHELLAGTPPFSGGIAELRRKHAGAAYPADALRAIPIDEPVIGVLVRAAEKNPLFRAKTGGHLARALRKAMPDEKVWQRGSADLERLGATGSLPGAPPPTDSRDSSAYYEGLSAKAALKRQAMEGSVAGAAAGAPVDRSIIDAGPGRAHAAQSAISASTAIGHVGTIEASVPCIGCDYDLRGLPTDGPCPECAKHAHESLLPDRLMFADRRWLLSRSLALQVVFMGLFAIYALAVIGLGASQVWPDSRTSSPAKFAYGAVNLAFAIGIVVAGLLWTRPESGRPATRRAECSRWTARILALAILLLVSLNVWGDADAWWRSLANEAAFGFFSVLCLGWARGVMAMAARIPDRRLEQTARQLLWLIAIGLAAYGVALMHDLADGPLPRTLRSLVAVLTVSVGGVGALIVASKAEKALKRVRALAVPRSRLLPGDDAQATITPSPPADHGGRPGLYDTLTARVALKRAAAAARTAVPGLAPLDPTAQRRGRAGLRIGRGRARARTLAAYLATHDAPCPQCGYLLRGLTSMKCPECGLPLRLDTVRPDPAESTYISEYEAVDWVRSWWLVVTIVVFVITMVAMILNK